MNKLYTGIVLFLMLAGSIQAQQITLLDETTLQPIENVIIADDVQQHFVLSNSQGNADISTFNKTATLLISHPSYENRIFKKNELMDAPVIYLHENVIKLSEIVISHNRWQQKQSDVSSHIVSIPAKAIALDNPQTAADLVGNSNEVFIQKSQLGGGSPMIRGFATNRVLIAVDGIRMNNAIFRSGNLQNIINIDPYTIAETEVLFGPGSVIYGSDAIGGVMSFTTIKPALSDSNKVLLKGQVATRISSANGETSSHFNINAGWKKWAFLTSFSQNKFGDLRMGSNGPDDYLRTEYVQRINGTDVVVQNTDPLLQVPSGFSEMHLMEKIRFKPNKQWEFNYELIYSTTSEYSRYDRLIRFKNGLPRSAEWYYGPQKWLMHNLQITNTQSNLFYDEMSLRLAYQQFEESRYDRDFNDSIKHERIENVDALSVNLDFRKTIGSKQELFYGVEAVYNDITSTGNELDIINGTSTVGPARYPQSDWSSYAAYATYQLTVFDNLKMNAGLRYNQFLLHAKFDNTFYNFPFTTASLNKGALTGSMGFIYHPVESTWLTANFSTGFRSPNVDDIGKVFDSEPGSVVVPNPDLEAEYAYNAEFGVTQLLGDFLKFNATVYYTLLENAMVRRDFQLNGADSIMYDGELSQVQAIQNAAKADIYGIQAGMDVKLPQGFGISSRINYQQGEEEMDDGTTSPLRHAAPLFGATHATYTTEKLKFDLYAIYNAEIAYENLPTEEQDKDYLYASDANGNPYVPAWYTLNLKTMYQFNPIFSVSAGIENITDIRYRPYSSGITAPGRNFIFSVKANF